MRGSNPEKSRARVSGERGEMETMEAGLVGIGRMGAGIAKSLLRAGHGVTAYNRTRGKAEALRSAGAKIANSIAEACRGEVVLTMVADDAALEAVVFGKGGVLHGLRKGAVHVSLSTISVAMAFERKSGVDARALLEFLTGTLFDAPVYKSYGALVVEGKHEQVGFAAPLGLKDVRLVLEAAGAKNVAMPIASVLRDRLLTAVARGNAEKDWSVLGRIAAEDAGLS